MTANRRMWAIVLHQEYAQATLELLAHYVLERRGFHIMAVYEMNVDLGFVSGKAINLKTMRETHIYVPQGYVMSIVDISLDSQAWGFAGAAQ